MKVILKGYQKVGKILEVFKKKDSILNTSCKWQLDSSNHRKEGYFDLTINEESQNVRFDYLHQNCEPDNGEVFPEVPELPISEKTYLIYKGDVPFDEREILLTMECLNIIRDLASSLEGGWIFYDDGTIEEITGNIKKKEGVEQFYNNPVKKTWILQHNSSCGLYPLSRFDSKEEAYDWMVICALENIIAYYCPLSNFDFQDVDPQNLSIQEVEAALQLAENEFSICCDKEVGYLNMKYDIINADGEEEAIFDEFVIVNV